MPTITTKQHIYKLSQILKIPLIKLVYNHIKLNNQAEGIRNNGRSTESSGL